MGAGDYVSRFRCVTIELWTAGAIGPDQYQNPLPYMNARGFVLGLTGYTHERVAARGGRVKLADWDLRGPSSKGQVQIFFLYKDLALFRDRPPLAYEHCQLPDAHMRRGH